MICIHSRDSKQVLILTQKPYWVTSLVVPITKIEILTLPRNQRRRLDNSIHIKTGLEQDKHADKHQPN